MEKQQQHMYFGGVPTAIEVDKLLKTYSTVEVGRIITHEEIEALVGVERARNLSRYHTITTRFAAKIFRQYNVRLLSLRGVGYRVLSPNERVDLSIDSAGSAVRHLGRALRDVVSAPRIEMNETEKQRADHVQATIGRLHEDGTKARNAVKLPKQDQARVSYLQAKS